MTESKFFDIDCILAEDEKVHTEMLIDAFNLERLEFQFLPIGFPAHRKLSEEPGENEKGSILEEPKPIENGHIASSQLKKKDTSPIECYMVRHTKFKIPVWMALSLNSQRVISIQLPKYYENEFINMVLAHPQGINLCEKNFYYYEFGVLISKKLNKNFIAEYLSKIFLARIKQIFLIVFHSNDSMSSSSFLQKITNIEHIFYEKGKRAMIEFNVWNSGKVLEHQQYKSFLSRKKVKTS
jgi:hypothetical protein